MSNMNPTSGTKEFNWIPNFAEGRIELLEEPLEAFIKQVLAKSGIPTRSEFDALSKKIDELSARK